MYSWGEDEIVTMMDDILAFDPSSRYCLGSLIVSSRDHPEGVYEVIDGQQRLTTLVLLLKELVKPLPHDFLQFACRPDWEQKAGYQRDLIHDRVEEYTKQWSVSTSGDPSGLSFAEEMVSRLRHVDLFCIEVPECTDLNHYFEVMNTMGVQLRQEDILKARLMGALNPEEQESFARDWSACLDFTKMYQPDDVKEGDSAGSDQHRYTVKDILDSDGHLWSPSSSGASSAGSLLPISNVPTFLLHVLRVYEEEKGAGSPSIDETLLLSEFSRQEGIQGNHGKTEERFPREFVLVFQKKMKRLRILMDRYLICRERQAGQNGRTVFRFRNRKDTEQSYLPAECRQNCLHIQAALRVSYVSQSSMHWITELLKYLDETADDTTILPDASADAYLQKAESIAAAAITKQFLDIYSAEKPLGVATPHIVFNFLDYLLWKNDTNS